MTENIIHINREEFDRLSLLTNREDYLEQTFNIAINNKFPLHKIHYVFEHINPGEVYEIDTLIKADDGSHTIRCVCYCRHKCIGIVTVTMTNYDTVKKDWETSFKVKAIQRNKEEWLKEIGLMTATTNMTVAYAMLNAKRVFTKDMGKHHIVGTSKSDADDLIYNKLKAYISSSHTKSTKSLKGICPQHEFDVRGHMRHYKSGKVGFVRPYTKCKGRGSRIIHEYKVIERESINADG